MGLPVLSAAPVTIRHLRRGTGTGQITLLAATLVPQPRKGVNGRRGYQSGSYEAALNDEGTATIAFPNTVGDDGVLHRRRFLILTDPGYHPGDEWIEILQSGRVLFVGTPLGATKTRGQISLRLADGQWLLRKQRETTAGFWTHAPRDVFEHYTKARRALVADTFTSGADPALWDRVLTTDGAGYVRLGSPAGSSYITALSATADLIAVGPDRAWRLEMEYDRACNNLSAIWLRLSPIGVEMSIDFTSGTNLGNVACSVKVGAPIIVRLIRNSEVQVKKGASMAIEARDRHVFFYLDGRLVHAQEGPLITDATTCAPQVQFDASGSTGTIDVKSILLRRAEPFLMRGSDKGDYRLGGSPPSGGLQGSYFDDADLRTPVRAGYDCFVLVPTRSPYARRQDATVNFANANPPAWQPAGPPGGEFFSVRWTGAIFLDLAAADITLQLTALNYGVRLWVGKTMFGQQLLDNWGATGAATLTSGSLRTHLASGVAGWYPIRLEWVQRTGANGLVLQQSIGGGAYAAVPTTSLSPLGIYDSDVRYDSHSEQIKAIAETFALQFRCEPRSLESGVFPGEVVPRVRVGRDTDKVLEPTESTDVTVTIDAEDVSDTMLADAAGINDPANASQLTAENVNYASIRDPVAANRHPAVLTDYQALADITDPNLLRTRLDSLLGLRASTWQEVGARPRGYRERRDTFPLTGVLATFAWEPGDAVRLRDDDVDLDDSAPRQIIAPSWPFAPDGLGSPSVRFRQRPRSQQDALRAIVRSALLPQRNYQGTLTVIPGALGSTAPGEAPDNFTRAPLPANLADVVKAELVVARKGDASSWVIEINGVSTGLTLTTIGRFDVTAYIAAGTIVPGAWMFAKLTGGTSTYLIRLDLTVRI